MADILLDPTTHDIVIRNYDMVLQSGADEVAQNLKIRFLFYQGEWRFNPSEGMPYFQEILKKYSDEATVAGIFRQALEEAPNVSKIIEFNPRFDRKERKFSLSFKVQAIDGTIVEVEEFIVNA